MGEVVKHGVLEPTLFTWLEKNSEKILKRDVSTIQKMLVKNIEIKQAIVESDEKESGQRMLLNLGHTFGHAVEQLSGYAIPHGQAVAIGLVYAMAYARMEESERVVSLLHAFGLPSHLETPYSAKSMVKAMQSDKKNRGKNITLVLPQTIGEVHIHTNETPSKIERFLKKYHDQNR